MEEFKLYIQTLKQIVDRFYEKEMVFYDETKGWYSRYHCEYLSNEEFVEWVLELTNEEETNG